MKWEDEECNILETDYITKGSDIPELLINHTNAAIRRRAHISGIKNRELFKSISINKELHAVIDGLVLSDAYVGNRNNKTARLFLVQTEKHLNWLRALKKFFERNNIQCSNITIHETGGERYINGIKTLCKTSYQFYTMYYTTILTYKHRWYLNGKKIVPPDVNLSPISLAQWYMGDGTRDKRRIRLATMCFDKCYINLLINKLNEKYGWHSRLTGRNELSLSIGKEVTEFLQFTEPYKIDCFDYKWRES